MSAPVPTPIVFIHGLWLHATSWQPWIERFEQAGYAPIAPGWPHEPATVADARANPDAVAGLGIDDMVAHFAEIAKGLDASPVLIGHSFGGLYVQKLLGRGIGRAGIAIDPAQIKGVLPLPFTQLRSVMPVLRNPLNARHAVSLTAKQFRYGFGNAISGSESNELYKRYTVPSPAKPLFEGAVANFNPRSAAKVATDNADRGPLLLISGLSDNTVPDVVTRSTYKQYAKSSAVTELKQFSDRGHSLVVDTGWSSIAESCLEWLDGHGVGAGAG